MRSVQHSDEVTCVVRYSGFWRASAWLLLTAAVAVLCSCGSDTCGPSRSKITRNTPEGLLDVLEASFGRRDLMLYDQCLEDGYTFEFAEDDAGFLGLASWDPCLHRMEDTSAVANMFRDEAVKQIEFDLAEIGRLCVEDRGDSVVVLTLATEVSVTVEYPGSEPFVFLIRDTRLEITAAPDPATDSLWVIRKMKEYYMYGDCRAPVDRGAGSAWPVAAATAPTSLGMLKAYFHDISPRSTVSRLLETYFRSCEAGNIDMYEECLADYYRFIFVPWVADYLSLPADEPWWGKMDDMRAMARLFASEEVISVRFDYVPVLCDTLVENDSLVVEMRLWPYIVVVIDGSGSEPVTYVVGETFLDFKLVRDPHFPDTNLWVMLETEEIPLTPPAGSGDRSAVSGSESSTYSMIKAIFR